MAVVDLSCFCTPPSATDRIAIARELIRPHEVDSVARTLFRNVRLTGHSYTVFVAAFMKSITYEDDPLNCDRWCSPSVTLYRRSGDCDDTAILATSLFWRGGVFASFVFGRYGLAGHAWVEGHDENGFFLLETTSGELFRHRPPMYIIEGRVVPAAVVAA